MTEFILYIDDDGIKNKAPFIKHFEQLAPGRYKVTSAKSNKRSLQQNAWLHAVLPEILAALRNMGYNQLRTTDDAKLIIKSLFFKKIITNGIEEIELIEDTSKTSKEVFIERADQIIHWAKDYLGIDIAPPLKKFEMFEYE